MLKIYHLSNCGTCQRIIKEWELPSNAVLQDIKKEPMTAEQVDEMKNMAGSYEALFSRKSLKYRAWGLHEKTLTEDDYKKLIVEEYTFLKRPVMINGNDIFVGNAPKIVESAKNSLEKSAQ